MAMNFRLRAAREANLDQARTQAPMTPSAVSREHVLVAATHASQASSTKAATVRSRRCSARASTADLCSSKANAICDQHRTQRCLSRRLHNSTAFSRARSPRSRREAAATKGACSFSRAATSPLRATSCARAPAARCSPSWCSSARRRATSASRAVSAATDAMVSRCKLRDLSASECCQAKPSTCVAKASRCSSATFARTSSSDCQRSASCKSAAKANR
mmetsp:Transcript_25768/g.73622  ORF Transcript_25768/g.73622 Transcript_25768/m.73622 type:complete len:219 (-) Transcript_25768:229-885(-)